MKPHPVARKERSGFRGGAEAASPGFRFAASGLLNFVIPAKAGIHRPRTWIPLPLSRELKAAATTCLIAGLLLPCAAAAHPLGNATVNRQAALAVAPGELRLDFRMDMAEIPSLAAEAEADTNGDGAVDAAEWRSQNRRWAAAAAAGLRLTMNGRPVAWRLERAEHELAEGEAGLPLVRLRARYRAALPAAGETSTLRLTLDDRFRPAERGWREIWMSASAGLRFEGDVARVDRSHGLTAYPEGQALPDERRAEVVVLLPAPAKVPATSARAPDEAVAPAPAEAAGVVAGPETPASEPSPTPPPEPSAAPTPAQTPAPSLAAMFRLGLHHILTGFDHLAFLAGLLLLSPGWRGAVKVVTAFTVAHSLTLILAARGLVALPPAWVEAAIALTVAWVGALALAGRGRAHGFGLAFAFGLVHGLGFAGAMAESLGGGAPPLVPLLAFNLGIEAGQLALVALVLGGLAALRRHALPLAPAHRLASLAVTGGGLAWFVVRIAG